MLIECLPYWASHFWKFKIKPSHKVKVMQTTRLKTESEIQPWIEILLKRNLHFNLEYSDVSTWRVRNARLSFSSTASKQHSWAKRNLYKWVCQRDFSPVLNFPAFLDGLTLHIISWFSSLHCLFETFPEDSPKVSVDRSHHMCFQLDRGNQIRCALFCQTWRRLYEWAYPAYSFEWIWYRWH